jgi:hypothetical protein
VRECFCVIFFFLSFICIGVCMCMYVCVSECVCVGLNFFSVFFINFVYNECICYFSACICMYC